MHFKKLRHWNFKKSQLRRKSWVQKWTSLSYTQSDTFKVYKKLATLRQERCHCIRNWFRLTFKKWFLKCGIPLYLWVSLGHRRKPNFWKTKKMLNFVPTFQETSAEKAHNSEYASHLHLTIIPLEKHHCLKIQFKTRAMNSSILSSGAFINSCRYYASVNSKHQHPPLVDPRGLHSSAAPGPAFILDDLPQGPGFCISIKLHLVQWKNMLSLNWHLDHTSMCFMGSSDLVF